jgi:putative endonuclease
MDTSTHRRPLHVPAADTAGAPIGALGEDLAARHLVADDGLEVIARNWRLRAGELRGELDLVALDRRAGCVVVCEVKTRRDAERFGGALAAVSPRKRGKVRALTGAFLRQADLRVGRVRIDVIAVDLGRRPVLHHVLDAL